MGRILDRAIFNCLCVSSAEHKTEKNTELEKWAEWDRTEPKRPYSIRFQFIYYGFLFQFGTVQFDPKPKKPT